MKVKKLWEWIWLVCSELLTNFFISARVGCEPHSYPKNGNTVNGFRAASAWDKGRVGGRCVSSNACVTHSVLCSDYTDSYIDLVANNGFEGSKGGSKIPPCFLGGWGGGCNDHKLYKWSNCSKSDMKGPLSVTSKVLFIIVSMGLKCVGENFFLHYFLILIFVFNLC